MAAMADLGFPGELRSQPHIAESGIASRTRDWAYAPVNVASSLQILIGKVRNLSDQDLKQRCDIHVGICAYAQSRIRLAIADSVRCGWPLNSPGKPRSAMAVIVRVIPLT